MTKTQQINKTKHGKHKSDYYAKNKQKYLIANQKYRAKLKVLKQSKLPSLFLQKRQQNFINCLDKHHITVPIPRFLKTKHPIIQG